ncbi:MAG: diguanylate cyclase [Alphaproteobacteria bacterium]|nr:diguanylate cyclase [Alphaproteobacteria bacterium]
MASEHKTFDTETHSSPITVMICESSQVQLRILSKAVSDAGFEVQTANNSEEALDIMRLMPVDIFLTGIEVGEINGLEACWSLKGNAETESTYTIIVTASGDESRLEESLDAGADDFIRKPVNMTELRARLRAASRLVRMQKQFRRLAETDSLTGSSNRRAFMQYLEMEVERSSRHGAETSVIMLDLDHFKKVNDTYGHAAGDKVLIETVKAIQSCLRPKDMLGRLGGEEFAILLQETDLVDAAEISEQIRSALEQRTIDLPCGGKVNVTGSMGVSNVCELLGQDSPETVLQAADEALYYAKQSGRNQVIVCNPDYGDDEEDYAEAS